jgi:predicted outer membrane repeat protein
MNMKQKMKKNIIALAIGLFFGGRNISAVSIDVDAFSQFINAISIDNFDIRFTAPIYQWTQNLTINNNGIIRGGLGNNLAILDGHNLYRAFSVVGKTIDFYDNFEFKNFRFEMTETDNGVIYAYYSNINFTNSVVNFISNNVAGVGVICADNNANINFTSSVVNFTRNSAENGGGIYAKGGDF